ncbi:MAG: amidohydrolase family protein [Armatimonadota bacterium]|nr:amidohydrolase family protein [Armatimonadota bacterium]MDR7443247.1 amidohydrolase family protein [Armatimonadota bacterium]MDR7571086.1 amidohydrolase family protein [Armatimonadota bacterium]MDR7614422.1 amidohydrolase family protein [Armatimonadota bacterium]
MLKIDAFCHIYPKGFYDRMVEHASASGYLQRLVRGVSTLWDLEKRFRIMDTLGAYVQVPCLAAPPIEAVATGPQGVELARAANDGMAELVDRYPDRFVGFVASLPLDDVEAAVREAERAVEELGATGVQIFTNVLGKPLDQPEFLPLFERMAAYDLPIWVHPTRGQDQADYPTENRSKYDIWWALGWPYETGVFMTRMVFSGIFDRLPNLKIITHHLGGIIPYVEGRLGWGGLDRIGHRTDSAEDVEARRRLKRSPHEYFRMFYADTALFGNVPGVECGVAFFGAEHVLFGSDMPFGPEEGAMYVREAIRAVENMTASLEDKRKIFEENARKLLRLRLPR